MAILPILKYPEPFLRTKATAIEAVDESVRALIRDMTETMYAGRGIGLAATQVGSDKRVIVLDVPDEIDGGKDGEGEAEGPPRLKRTRGKNLVALINPEVVLAEGKTKYEEGCLSVPGINAYVERAVKVRVRAVDKDGNDVEMAAEGLFAIALQHEIDHLDGILFIDRLSRLKRQYLIRKYNKAMEERLAL